MLKQKLAVVAERSAINRRTVVAMPAPVLGSLRWPGRPEFPDGNPCWTYMVEHDVSPFAVHVGHVENGRPHPFEVWVTGDVQPRGLGAVAKTLSADMRTQDRTWLAMKLDALSKVADGTGIELSLGTQQVRVPSSSAAMARVVQHRLVQLGVSESDPHEASPLVDAMLSLRSMGSEGTMSWTVDVSDPASGDSFTVFMPEVDMPEIGSRPIALKLAGRYPRELDGLAALLSIDMQVVDVAWIGMKLRKLLNYKEPMSSFYAKVPGTDVTERFQSVVSYLASMIIYRYATLGLLTSAGYPVSDMGVMVNVRGDATQVVPVAA